ncbi:MAG: hypothetical protein EOM25_14970 [Deltaproteobacteria bacterium]|nr:hypothetical protein [Deltaproteobacteria bacterium]
MSTCVAEFLFGSSHQNHGGLGIDWRIDYHVNSRAAMILYPRSALADQEIVWIPSPEAPCRSALIMFAVFGLRSQTMKEALWAMVGTERRNPLLGRIDLSELKDENFNHLFEVCQAVNAQRYYKLVLSIFKDGASDLRDLQSFAEIENMDIEILRPVYFRLYSPWSGTRTIGGKMPSLDKRERLPQTEEPAPRVENWQVSERSRLFDPDRERRQTHCRYGAGFIPWNRILIRSGFVFEETNGAFDFSAENEPNRAYLGRMLAELGLTGHFDGTVFRPPSPEYDENSWLSAWEGIHSGSEGPSKNQMGFENIDLEEMDTAMAGVVRWLNRMGHDTVYSCDGHGRAQFFIQSQTGNVFDDLQGYCRLPVMRGGQNSSYRLLGPNGRPVMDPRKHLLDLAEDLFAGRRRQINQPRSIDRPRRQARPLTRET